MRTLMRSWRDANANALVVPLISLTLSMLYITLSRVAPSRGGTAAPPTPSVNLSILPVQL